VNRIDSLAKRSRAGRGVACGLKALNEDLLRVSTETTRIFSKAGRGEQLNSEIVIARVNEAISDG
jgi:hypothetical protein